MCPWLLLDHAVLQALGGGEGGVLAGRDLDGLAGGRVTACTGGTLLGAEAPEAADVDLAAGVEFDSDDPLAILGREDDVVDLGSLGLGAVHLLCTSLLYIGLIHAPTIIVDDTHIR